MEKLLCGVDIGGTKLSVGLVHHDGKILEKITVFDHTGKDETGVVFQISDLIRKLLLNNGMEESGLAGIGIGFPGHVRYKEGITITSSNLKGFKNFQLREAVAKNFTVPVILDNDANAQAFCEFKYGAGTGYDDLIFLTISTGIGAGIILNRKLYRGMTGTAGEFGHTIVNPDSDLLCTCGNKGCLMACACGLALPHLFRQKIRQGMKTTLPLKGDFDKVKIDGKLIKQGLDSGDPVSQEVMNDCAGYVGIGLYNIFQVFNPPLIILGGGLCSWGDLYLDKIKTRFYELARDMIFDKIEIIESASGNDAGLIGAAALLLE